MLKEFKEFLSKGNVLDLAVGIIVGAAFGKIVSSLVGDIIMPLVGLFAGKINFSHLYISLDFNSYESLELAKKASAPLLMYGNFLQAVLDFIIVGFAIFMIVRLANKVKKVESVAPSTKSCSQCLSVIPLMAKKCAHCGSLQDS
ncbi:MAG TPA: large conductance mechanosensitive channel protein MscL [Pseudobdellovibrionaceae bacterium]|nr:large conductance mechanosensitive channel protein MscL [Pseudobdellovibrionaceae bacterium]